MNTPPHRALVLSSCSDFMRFPFARPAGRGVELPLIISDHVDWPQLTATLSELAPQEVWITHGAEEGLTRWCELKQMPARPLRLVGYEEEPE